MVDGKLNGSKNYTTMKKYIKLFALVAMALFVGSCEDELQQAFEPVQIVPGEEILFGACYRPVSADKAPADRTTRTVYGETNANKDTIEINWIPEEDRMLIASPQSAGAARGVAEYMVKTASEDSESYDGASVVTELVRTGDAGLQWGNIAQGTVYDFYAVYPSVNQLKESVADGAESCSLSKDGLLSGYLPTDQSWTDVKSTNNRYIFSPNMDYAYMVAKTNYTINKDEEGAAFMGKPISLDFESMVTALQFEIKAGTLKLIEDDKITITSVALFSQSGQQLAGDFKYDIAKNATPGLVTKGNTSYSQVIQKFEGSGIPLNNEQTSALDLTFFLLPSVENYASGDLRLQIMYEVNGTPQIKTATIGTEIPARVKRYFSNVKLPAISGEVDASKWFQALNPNVLVSQVSIPVAANTFANSSYGLTDTYRTQQTLTIEDMWDMGVRGFEMVNRSYGSDKTGENLEGYNMVASESTEFNTGTFCANLKKLYDKQKTTFVYKKDANGNNTAELESGDPIILICTYGATGDGYNPRCYVANLFNSLSKFCTDNSVAPSTFVQLTSNSTVMDIMGKICVIIRPGTDERWAYETNTYTDPYNRVYSNTENLDTTDISKYGLTYSLPNVVNGGTNAWWDKVLLISDWGMDSWDSWHRRFGEAGFYHYATTGTNYDELGNKRKSLGKMEAYIVGEKTPMPETSEYYYPYDLSNGNTAYIQDMVRIVPTACTNKELTLKYATSEWYGLKQNEAKATVTWVESLSEKKNAIRGLFELAVDTKGGTLTNDIYINNLSGYYQTENWEYLKERTDAGIGGWGSEIVEGGLVSYFPIYDAKNFKNSGKGGDYKACAEELTKYVYGVLSGDATLSGEETKLADGPWGLVMMDYIGSTTYSNDLVYLIMMNNFAGFELAEKQNEKAKATKVPFSDEEISPELDVLVNWD